MANDKFSSGKYTYPLNLEADEYGGNYVIYQIGVSGKSASASAELALADGAGISTINSIGAAKANNSNLSGLEFDATSVDNYTRTLPYASAAGFGGVGLAGADPKLVIGAAVFIGNTIRDKIGDISPSNYQILKESICLYMPDVSMKYSASWEDKSLAYQAILQKISKQLDEKTLENLTDKYITGGLVGMVANETIGKAFQAGSLLMALKNSPIINEIDEGVLKNLALSLEPTQIIQKQAGIARNPLSELLFTNIDRRTFTHKFSFFPRSKAEADSVREIIRLFKYHMHPEYIPNNYNLNYIYPSEFYISYYTNNQPSNTLPKHAACALTSLDVDYSKGDQFSTLKDGTPTEITMTLSFSELALLTKESFSEAGGNLS